MEDDRKRNRRDEDEQWTIPDDERVEWVASSSDDEPPFHIPRD